MTDPTEWRPPPSPLPDQDRPEAIHTGGNILFPGPPLLLNGEAMTPTGAWRIAGPLVELAHAEAPRVAVVGTRTFSDYPRLKRALDAYRQRNGLFVVVTGTFPEEVDAEGRWVMPEAGADQLAVWWAQEVGFPCRVFPAAWRRYGAKGPDNAGYRRNQQIADYLRPEGDIVLAFWDGESPGTGDVVRRLKGRGITVIRRPVVAPG